MSFTTDVRGELARVKADDVCCARSELASALLASGGMDVAGFAAARGLTVGELGTMVFILTGMSGLRLRQLFQFRLADDLLRYTSLPLAEVARLSGNGSAINLYQTLRRECNMSASERRAALRNDGDLGRFAL